jgi:hypothetical protein
MASAAAILDLFDHPRRGQRIVQAIGTVGRVGEVAAGRMVELSASRVAKVGEVLHSGAPAKLWNVAKVLTAASLIVTFVPGKSRDKASPGGSPRDGRVVVPALRGTLRDERVGTGSEGLVRTAEALSACWLHR